MLLQGRMQHSRACLPRGGSKSSTLGHWGPLPSQRLRRQTGCASGTQADKVRAHLVHWGAPSSFIQQPGAFIWRERAPCPNCAAATAQPCAIARLISPPPEHRCHARLPCMTSSFPVMVCHRSLIPGLVFDHPAQLTALARPLLVHAPLATQLDSGFFSTIYQVVPTMPTMARRTCAKHNLSRSIHQIWDAPSHS